MDEDEIVFENNDEDEYEYEDEDEKEELDEDIRVIMKDYETKRKNFKTTPTLSKYEKTRILSERSSQINRGAKPFIINPSSYSNAYDIALQEFNEKKIPFIIKRPYGNTFEYWKLNDLLN
jgi:DNA-directed RNA polymerase I, II, and III subunit RPABC2